MVGLGFFLIAIGTTICVVLGTLAGVGVLWLRRDAAAASRSD
jgi:hypothetical protein